MFLRNTTVDGFTYDAQGRYTTGSASLDTKLNNIVETYTNSSMTRDQKLRALYNYVRDNFSYLKRDLVSKGETGWEPAYAEEFLNLRRGNCHTASPPPTACWPGSWACRPTRWWAAWAPATAPTAGWRSTWTGTTYMFDPPAGVAVSPRLMGAQAITCSRCCPVRPDSPTSVDRPPEDTIETWYSVRLFSCLSFCR